MRGVDDSLVRVRSVALVAAAEHDPIDGDRAIVVSAALIVDAAGRVLLVRKRGSDRFMQAGGKPEPGETAYQALLRELSEELGFQPDHDAVEPIGRFDADAANEAGRTVSADVFRIVASPLPTPLAEIAEARWFTPAQADALGVRLAPLARMLLDRV